MCVILKGMLNIFSTLVVFSPADSFGFICPVFQRLDDSEISASIPVQ